MTADNRRWIAIVNPHAGRGRARRWLRYLRAALEARGVTVRVTLDESSGLEVARQAFAAGESVIACGGDGTIAGVAGVAAEARGVLALVPLGSGNDLARHLGIGTRDPLRALELLDTGTVGRVDLGRVTADDGTTRWFTTVAHTGFDAEANRWANTVTWVRGTTLYVLAVLRTLVSYHPTRVQLVVDGVSWNGDAWLVAVGNTRCYAGGMMITPNAEIDDAALDVCVVAGVSRATFLAQFPRVFRGTHPAIRGVHLMRGKVIEIEAPGAALELYASGERIGPLPARVEVAAGALRVLRPPAARPVR